MPAMKTDICIIGAGPAGLMAAINAAKTGAGVIIIESNPTAGKKLLRTGRGRCNITNLAKPAEILKAYGKYERFLRHAMYEFSPEAVVAYFQSRGVPTKLEKNATVWPVSDKASDVKEVLVRDATQAGSRFIYGRPVQSVSHENGLFRTVFADGSVESKALIIATGGASWPDTGSTGDGYTFAKSLGHKIIQPRAALVPLVTREKWPGTLAGVSLGKIGITAKLDGKKISVTGEALFTHTGIGGPAPFDMSRLIIDELAAGRPVPVQLDFLPDRPTEQLEREIDKTCQEHPRLALFSLVSRYVARALAEQTCRAMNEDMNLHLGQLSRPSRKKLLESLKAHPLTITSARPLEEATVTHGGVALDEIDPKTMMSKKLPALFFAGEVIDADGPCGGYNLQIAFCTGTLAGKNAAKLK